MLNSSNDELNCDKEDSNDKLIEELKNLEKIGKPEINLYKIWKDNLAYPPYEDSFKMSNVKKTSDDIRKKYHEYLKFVAKNPSTKMK